MLLLMLSVMALGVAADRLYIEDFVISPGATANVPLMLDNEATYTAFQADVTLPDVLSVNQDTAAYGFMLTGRKGNHMLSVSRLTESTYRLVSYSVGLDTYHGESGALLTVAVTAAATFRDTATITLSNVRFTTPQAVEVSLEDQTCTLSAAWRRGDVNDDGEVDIGDIVRLIDYLLNNETAVNAYNADVLADGEITVGDVTALIDYLLRGSWP